MWIRESKLTRHLYRVPELVLWDDWIFPQDVDSQVWRWGMHGGIHVLIIAYVSPSHSNWG